jgi:hypothetical protein
MLKKVEGVWDYFKPAMLSAEIQTDFKEELLLSIDAREGRNRFSARSTSFEEPLRMELDLPKVRVGPVQGLALRAALVPGLGPLIRSEKISVNGVVPTLFSNGNEVNGLSFSVAHSNVKDSIYITCLDSLLDLEGSVELDSLGFKGDFLVNALGIGLFDTANADVVFSSDINLQSNYKGEGTLILKDVLISRPIESVFLSSFIASHFYDSGQRSLTVNSDVMQVNMVGAWDIEDLIPMSDLVLLSLSGQDSRRAWPYANLDIEAQFGDVQWLISLLHLPFKLPEGGIIEGRINGKKEGWQLVAAVPKLESDGLSLRGFKGQVSYALGHVSGSANLDEFHLGTWDLVDLGAKWIPATVGNGIQFRGVVVDSIPSDVKIEGSYGDGWGQMEQASFNVGLDEFKLSAPGRVEWSDDRIKFESIEFARESSKFKINGGLNSKNDMQLKLALENINSGTLNYLLRDPNLLLSGRLNANLKISGTFESTYAIGSLDWTDFGINNHKYGSIKGDFRWDENKDDLFLQTTVGTLSKTPLRLRGHYMPERDELDLALTADAFDIDPFGSYVAGTIDEIQGLLSGGVAIYGPLKEWKMEGGFALKSAHIKVPLVGAELVSKNEVNLRLTETEIILDSSILVHPVQQSPAVVWGKITHDRFDKIKFDLKLHTDSLLGLDLNRSYDSYFYGKALVGGDLWLDGPLERLHMDVKLETKEGTHFKIPLDNPTAIETPTFMRFVSSELATNEDSTNTILAQEYFTTDIDITATKEAQIDLVLDEVLGDVIKAKGEGNLRMKILEDESFELYGLYKVVEGNYLFTLQNIINKQFELVPGGTILWSGDLYDADLNLQAKYALSTDLGGLITNPSYRNENVDVDLIIELTGALMAPNISFRVELPNSPPSYQEELDRRILNEDAMNYQAFSLLMLGKFYQQNLGVQESINFYGTVSKSTSEVLVSQFGSWITAGLGNYVDIELDYTTGSNPYNTLTTTSDEIKLGVSKDFLDGRLRINSSVDVPVSQNGNSTLLLGDTQIEYELTKDGRVLLKAFNRSNRNDPLMQSSGPYTQGVGIQFTKDFEKTGILKP